MSLKELTQEQINEMAMIEIATLVLKDENKAMDFRELFNRVAELKGYAEADKDRLIAQFYTDLNIDGRFLTKGSNLWGLKRWYPVEDIDEDISAAPKRKKKRTKAKKAKKEAEPEEPEDLDETVLEEDIADLEEEDLEAEELIDEDFEFDEDLEEDDEAEEKEEFTTDHIAEEK